MKLGILGGTFDPIHLGHLRVAEEIREELELDRVYLMPGSIPPHKDRKPVTPFHHRLAMTRLATEASSCLEAFDLEARRPGLSYSIETLKELHRVYRSDIALFFIIGMDAFLEIKTWKEYKQLFEYAHFVVLKRPGIRSGKLEAFLDSLDVGFKREGDSASFVNPTGNHLIYKEAILMDISSTRIREKVAAGKSIHFLVPESVILYITEKELYKINGESGKGTSVPGNY